MSHEIEMFRLIVEFGCFGLIVYLVVWGLPKERRETIVSFREEIGIERETCERRHQETLVSNGKIHGSVREVSHDVKGVSNQVSAHHAVINTVLGLRADTGLVPEKGK